MAVGFVGHSINCHRTIAWPFRELISFAFHTVIAAVISLSSACNLRYFRLRVCFFGTAVCRYKLRCMASLVATSGCNLCNKRLESRNDLLWIKHHLWRTQRL